MDTLLSFLKKKTSNPNTLHAGKFANMLTVLMELNLINEGPVKNLVNSSF